MEKRHRKTFKVFLERLDDRCLFAGLTPGQLVSAYDLAGLSVNTASGTATPADSPAPDGGTYYTFRTGDGTVLQGYIPEYIPGVPNGTGPLGSLSNPAPSPWSNGLIGWGLSQPVPPGSTGDAAIPVTLFDTLAPAGGPPATGGAGATPADSPAPDGGTYYTFRTGDGTVLQGYIPEYIPGVPNGTGPLGSLSNPDAIGGGLIGDLAQPDPTAASYAAPAVAPSLREARRYGIRYQFSFSLPDGSRPSV